jgi:K+-transporting ATPase A subunit
MTANAYLQLCFYIVVLIALAKPLGTYMARIYEGQPAFLNRLGAPFENLIYRVCGVNPALDMRWTQSLQCRNLRRFEPGAAQSGARRCRVGTHQGAARC